MKTEGVGREAGRQPTVPAAVVSAASRYVVHFIGQEQILNLSQVILLRGKDVLCVGGC